MFDWNDLRFFLELQRSGRLLTAAQRLKTTHATVARHIDAIEKSLGTALFVQHAQGYELTPAGEALLKHAEAMENVALLAEDELTHSAAPLGKIRLGVAEGLGVMFLAARMGGLCDGAARRCQIFEHDRIQWVARDFSDMVARYSVEGAWRGPSEPKMV